MTNRRQAATAVADALRRTNDNFDTDRFTDAAVADNASIGDAVTPPSDTNDRPRFSASDIQVGDEFRAASTADAQRGTVTAIQPWSPGAATGAGAGPGVNVRWADAGMYHYSPSEVSASVADGRVSQTVASTGQSYADILHAHARPAISHDDSRVPEGENADANAIQNALAEWDGDGEFTLGRGLYASYEASEYTLHYPNNTTNTFESAAQAAANAHVWLNGIAPDQDQAPASGDHRAFAQRVADAANLRDDGTSTLTVRVPNSNSYARIVSGSNRTIAYVRAPIGFGAGNQSNISFVRGTDEEITTASASAEGGPLRGGSDLIGVPNGAGRSFRLDEVDAAAAAINTVRDRPRRPAPTAPVARRRARTQRRQDRRPSSGLLPGMAGTGRTSVAPSGDSPEERTVGLEWEIDMPTGQEEASVALEEAGFPVSRVQHRYDGEGYSYANSSDADMTKWLVSSDPTIDYRRGTEVTMPPIYTNEEGLARLRETMAALTAAGGRQGNQHNYGIHVHVDWRDLTASQREAAVRTYENNRDHFDALVQSQRYQGNAGDPTYAGPGSGPSHSYEVNTDSGATVEFRRLGSTLDSDQSGDRSARDLEAWTVMLRQVVQKAKEGGGAISRQDKLEDLMGELDVPEAQKAQLQAREQRLVLAEGAITRTDVNRLTVSQLEHVAMSDDARSVPARERLRTLSGVGELDTDTLHGLGPDDPRYAAARAELRRRGELVTA